MKWLLALAVAGCTRASPPARSSDREAARTVLERHCGVCHREDSPRALEKALAVFNLNQPDWSAHMKPAQLRDAAERIRNLATMGDKSFAQDVELFGGPATRDEVDAIARFVGASDGG